MTIHLSLGCGDVSITRTLHGTRQELQAQVADLLDRLVAASIAIGDAPPTMFMDIPA